VTFIVIVIVIVETHVGARNWSKRKITLLNVVTGISSRQL
jgi:hypothetical protein